MSSVPSKSDLTFPSEASLLEVITFLQDLQLTFQLNKAEEVLHHARVDVAREVLEEVWAYAAEKAAQRSQAAEQELT